jgi:hypothetical protein
MILSVALLSYEEGRPVDLKVLVTTDDFGAVTLKSWWYMMPKEEEVEVQGY